MIRNAFKYIKKIKTTGAISESSKYVTKEITHEINRHKPQLIVELGAGTGNITEIILQKLHPDSILYCFEIEPQFYEKLENIKDKRFHLVKKSAADVTQYFEKGTVDVIISGLPLSLFADEEREALLANCYTLLKSGGVYRQFLYSFRKGYFEKIFDHMETRMAINFPPAILYSCFKVKDTTISIS